MEFAGTAAGSALRASRAQSFSLDAGLIVGAIGSVIRISLPLTITDEELSFTLQTLEGAIDAALQTTELEIAS